MLVDPELPFDPWDRLAREPIRWYARFEQYFRPLGPNRTLLGAYNAWRTVERERPPTNTVAQAWSKAAKEWEWRLRAELWDAQELSLLRQEEAELRQEWRDRRRDVLVVFISKLVDSMDAFTPDEENPPSLGQLTQAFRAVMDQVRTEFADEPVSKQVQVQVPVRLRSAAGDTTDNGEPEPSSVMTDTELAHELENIMAVLSGLPTRTRQHGEPPPEEESEGDSEE